MTITFIAKVSCDVPDCTSTAELPIDATVDSSRSGWSGCDCKVELSPETYVAGDLYTWNEYPPGKMTCPACMKGEGPALPHKPPSVDVPSVLFPVVSCPRCDATQPRDSVNTCCGKRLP